jgi:DNA-binding NtrC family response regulator
MTIRTELQQLVAKMLDGKILLPEAIAEFEKLYIERALSMTDHHLLKTAAVLGIHRNTLSKKLGSSESKDSKKFATPRKKNRKPLKTKLKSPLKAKSPK